MVADIEELEKLDTSEIHARRPSCRKMMNISYSRSQMEQSSCLEEIRFSEDPPRVGRVSTIGDADG